jgi:hypothetical protein
MRLVTTLLAISIAVPAVAQVTKQERAGIVNFSKVDAVVACGGATETTCGSASRVGGMWLVKRVLQDGWPIDKATEEAKAIGLRSEPLEKFALDYIATHKK